MSSKQKYAKTLGESEVIALLWLLDVWDELKHMAKTDEALAENLVTARQIVEHEKLKEGK